MKNFILSGVIIITLLSCNNCYSQDSVSNAVSKFPRNHIKFNFLPLFVHTLSFSYERKFTKRLSYEVEVGYIFPVNPLNGSNEYIGMFNGGEIQAFQGYLARGSIRYFEKEKENRNSIFFVGISALCKYRYYNDKKLSSNDGQGSHVEYWEQSRTLIAYACELQGGLRVYFPSFEHHFLLELSISFGGGMAYNKTDLFSHSKGGRLPARKILSIQ